MKPSIYIWLYICMALLKTISCNSKNSGDFNGPKDTPASKAEHNFHKSFKYTEGERIDTKLTFKNIPSDGPHVYKLYLVYVKGVWSYDVTVTRTQNTRGTTNIQDTLTTAVYKLYAILTISGILCSSQLILDGKKLDRRPTLSTSLELSIFKDAFEVDFNNACDAPVTMSSLPVYEGERLQFKCIVPTNVNLPPYLYYRWYYVIGNSTIPMGSYHWQSTTDLSLYAEKVDDKAFVQCKVTFNSSNNEEEIIVNNYRILISVKTSQKLSYQEVRYGDKQIIEFDCRQDIPSRSFGWELVELTTKNNLRIDSSLYSKKSYGPSNANTILLCLYFVGDESSYTSVHRIIKRKTKLVYDEQIISSFFDLANGGQTKLLITTIATAVGVLVIVIIAVYYIRRLRRNKRTREQKCTAYEMTEMRNPIRKIRKSDIKVQYDHIAEPSNNVTLNTDNISEPEYANSYDFIQRLEETTHLGYVNSLDATQETGHPKMVTKNRPPPIPKKPSHATRSFACVTQDNLKVFSRPVRNMNSQYDYGYQPLTNNRHQNDYNEISEENSDVDTTISKYVKVKQH